MFFFFSLSSPKLSGARQHKAAVPWARMQGGGGGCLFTITPFLLLMNLSEWPLSAGFVLRNKGAITGGLKKEGKGKTNGKLFSAVCPGGNLLHRHKTVPTHLQPLFFLFSDKLTWNSWHKEQEENIRTKVKIHRYLLKHELYYSNVSNNNLITSYIWPPVSKPSRTRISRGWDGSPLSSSSSDFSAHHLSHHPEESHQSFQIITSKTKKRAKISTVHPCRGQNIKTVLLNIGTGI